MSGWFKTIQWRCMIGHGIKEDGVDIYNSLDWVSKLPDEPKNYINDILFRKNTTFNTDFK